MPRAMAAGGPVRAGIGVLAVTLVAAARGAGAAELLPVDEAARRPDFFSFRARFQMAVARHDAEALISAASPDIKLSFGGDDGIEALRRWIAQPDGAFWAELGAVLALGGSFSGENSFVAPYTFSRWPEAFDSFEHVALVASDVRLREAPRPDAAVAAVKSFAILPLVPGGGEAAGAAWRAVRLPGGRVAYVSAALARSPIDYRAYFERRGGRWQLTVFVAGD